MQGILMGGKKTEACGRCSMSTVVDVASAGEGDDGDDGAEADGGSARDPFGEAAIEVDDETLQRASPGAWAGRVTARIDELADRVIRGR